MVLTWLRFYFYALVKWALKIQNQVEVQKNTPIYTSCSPDLLVFHCTYASYLLYPRYFYSFSESSNITSCSWTSANPKTSWKRSKSENPNNLSIDTQSQYLLSLHFLKYCLHLISNTQLILAFPLPFLFTPTRFFFSLLVSPLLILFGLQAINSTCVLMIHTFIYLAHIPLPSSDGPLGLCIYVVTGF